MRRIAQTAATALALLALAAPANAAVNQAPFPFFFLPLFGPAQPAPAPASAYQPQEQRSRVAAYTPHDEAVHPTRELIAYNGTQPAGTIVINTAERRLYYVLGSGKAIRYAVGVGRQGFQWSGTEKISNKQEWPDWRPPEDMLRRRPDLPRHMAGGLNNPLGARAMYLGGTLYRIHGSNEPETIGHAVSSGCIRMLNDDVVDLYGRVRIGTNVVVLR